MRRRHQRRHRVPEQDGCSEEVSRVDQDPPKTNRIRKVSKSAATSLIFCILTVAGLVTGVVQKNIHLIAACIGITLVQQTILKKRFWKDDDADRQV